MLHFSGISALFGVAMGILASCQKSAGKTVLFAWVVAQDAKQVLSQLDKRTSHQATCDVFSCWQSCWLKKKKQRKICFLFTSHVVIAQNSSISRTVGKFENCVSCARVPNGSIGSEIVKTRKIFCWLLRSFGL